MGNSKHLRYLCLLGGSNSVTLPSSVCRLYHLKILEGAKCLSGKSTDGTFPPGFSDAISLQKIKSTSFCYNKDRSDKLYIVWKDYVPSEEIDYQMEVIPHWNLEHLKLEKFGSESCPSWFRPNLLPRLCSLELLSCYRFKSMPFFVPLEGSLDNAAGSEYLNHHEESDNLNRPAESVQGFSSLTRLKIYMCGSLTYIPLHVWSSNLPSLEELEIGRCESLISIAVCGASSSGSGVKGFSSLAKISISICNKLLSLDEFLTPDYLPVVKTISVSWCGKLTSMSLDRLDGLHDLKISHCSKLNSQRVMSFPSSLKKLYLDGCQAIESIYINNSQLRSSSGLEHLRIQECRGLKSIGGAPAIDRIKNVSISESPELEDIQQPLNRGVIPEETDRDWLHL